MAPLIQILHSDLGLPSKAYLYKILSTSPRHDPLTYSQTDQLAAISSDDSLRFINPATLDLLPDGVIKGVNQSVTCLERVDDLESNLVATAGRDGFIRFWDKRGKGKVLEIQSRIENPNDGAGDSPVFLCTDGLISIFDTSKPDEEDALYQVINHRSAVAQAGFMSPSTDIYALGTDETVGFYSLQTEKEDEEEPKPSIWGDVREKFGVEYLAKMHRVGNEAFLAGGKHSESHLDLIPVQKHLTHGALQYEYDLEKRVRLPGAHGEEIVRDLFTDIYNHTTYTCGEDGHLRAWKLATGSESMDIENETTPSQDTLKNKDNSEKKNRREKRKEKKDRRRADGDEKGRYKPY